jgi:hypothetical protein
MEIPVHGWVGWGRRSYRTLPSLRCNQFRGAVAFGKPMVIQVVKEFPPPWKPKGDFHVHKCPSLILFWARLIQPLLSIPTTRLHLFPINMAWCRPVGVYRHWYRVDNSQLLVSTDIISAAATSLASRQWIVPALSWLLVNRLLVQKLIWLMSFEAPKWRRI